MEDRNAPATRGDVADLSQKLDQFRSDIGNLHNDLLERISDSEARLMRAFYDLAEANLKRLTMVETAEIGLRSRLATLEDRLLHIEKRQLNLPPG